MCFCFTEGDYHDTLTPFNPCVWKGWKRRERGEWIPGTTPLVAIALIDIAVNIVWRERERERQKERQIFSQFGKIFLSLFEQVYFNIERTVCEIYIKYSHSSSKWRQCRDPAAPQQFPPPTSTAGTRSHQRCSADMAGKLP